MSAALRVQGFNLPDGALTTPTTRRHARGFEPRSDAESPEVEEAPSPPSSSRPRSDRRREIIRQSSSSAAAAAAAVASLLLPFPPAAFAADDDDNNDADAKPQPSEPYTRTPSPGDKFQFGYTVTPPPSFVRGNKPLKTHLDEVNFSPPDVRGYTLGVTVDPVRISKIREFGTPGEVAARVVSAEVNRDGVFEVTLAKDPTEVDSGDAYDIEYISDGKRGRKRFATRIYVRDGFLYVLTVQSKDGEYNVAREAEVLECVKSFRPL